MEVISVYNNFANTGGAQDIALMLAQHFASGKQPMMLTTTSADNITTEYAGKADFRPLSLHSFRTIAAEHPGAIFLSHDRKSTTRLMIYRMLCRNHAKIVHVAHNVFDNLRFATLLPRHIVAISSGVRDNLISYFHIAPERITFIPNGMLDAGSRAPRDAHDIRILHIGRICAVKRQIEIARTLTGKMPEHTSLHFAGRGELEEELRNTVAGLPDTHYIGHIKPAEEIDSFDYVLLCSEREGLPLSLIEACMFGKPMITNALPSVGDINIHGVTGYVCSSDDALIRTVGTLPTPDSDEYRRLAAGARKRYEQYFGLEKMLSAYDELLNNVAADRN